MADTMLFDDFIEMLDQFGSDLVSWPLTAPQMSAVVTLLAHSAVARDAVLEMRGLEAQMRGDLPNAPAGLADRILAAAGVAVQSGKPIHARARRGRMVVN